MHSWGAAFTVTKKYYNTTAYSHADTEANEIHTINHYLHFGGGI